MLALSCRFLTRLGPDLAALILFTLVWIGMIAAYGGKIHFVEGSTILPSIIFLFFLGLAFVSHARAIISRPGIERLSFYRRARRLIRDWLPLIYLVGVYESLRDYTGIIRPDSIDTQLYHLDVAIFGVEPVIWIQRFIHPFLTDYFAFMYVLYFFLPMGVATLLYRAGRRQDFRELVVSCVLCMFTGFFLYAIFPAGPPRFYEGLPFEPQSLTGIFGFYEFSQGQFDSHPNVLPHASFPSLHVALSTLAVLHAWRFGHVWKRRWLTGINGWIALSIWVATIYLRHHWIVDIFAGWILAFAAYFGAIWIRRVWERMPSGAHKETASLPKQTPVPVEFAEEATEEKRRRYAQ